MIKIKKYSQKNAKNDLPRRFKHTHKSSYGKLLVIAGHEGFWGSGILACRGALKMGVGYVYWASHQNPQTVVSKIPEVLTLKISKIKDFSKFDAILIGPGLGVNSKSLKILKSLRNHPRVIVDADALTLLSKKSISIPETWILTPHPGELARILNTTATKINQSRAESLKQGVRDLPCNMLLKGYRSLVTDGEQIFEIQSGNEALAKAGSGDVLSGMVAGLLAQGLLPLKALLVGTFVHGFIANLWVKKFTSHSLNPSDLIDLIPTALKKIYFFNRSNFR